MKKSKQKKEDIALTKTQKNVFSKRHAAKLRDALLLTIIKEIR